MTASGLMKLIPLQSLNMTMALPTSKSQNDLLLKLMKHWNGRVHSPKFNTINAWIRAYIHDTYGGFFIVCDA